MDPETRYLLRIFFGTCNMYLWRERRPEMSKSIFRRSLTSRWNSRCRELADRNLAIAREIEGSLFYSPTWEALRVLGQEELGAWPSPTMKEDLWEIRRSMVDAPDDATRWKIEDYWRSTFEMERQEFPRSMSFDYLLTPRT